MSHEEELQEQYEDALFALMMDEVAKAQGQKALHEMRELEHDSNFVVPTKVHQRCIQTIHNHFRVQAISKVSHVTFSLFRRLAVVALISALLFTVALASSQELRIKVVNTLVQVLDDRTDITFEEGAVNAEFPIIEAEWLPEGFELDQEGESSTVTYQEFMNSDNQLITIQVRNAESGSSITIDTEETDVETISIDGHNASIIRKVNETQVYWSLPDRSSFVVVWSDGVPESDVIQVAENITIK